MIEVKREVRYNVTLSLSEEEAIALRRAAAQGANFYDNCKRDYPERKDFCDFLFGEITATVDWADRKVREANGEL